MRCLYKHGMKNFRTIASPRVILQLCALYFLLTGCAHAPSGLQNVPTPTLPPVVTDEYVLQPYDTLEIKFFYNPELNDTIMVRPDGKISLQMIDEIRAAGLTPAQLDDLLTQKYGLLLNRVMITVIVRTFTDQKVYVGGEVFLPQVVPLTGRMNALQAVFMAGGFKPDAKISNVIIISRGPGNKPVAREVNLKRAINGSLDFEEYRLKPFDIVYVPQTRIASIDQFLSHIYRFIPPQVGFGFTYEVHSESPD